MNTNRLSDSITAGLNAQMTKEAHAAQVYLAYGCWAAAEGYEGISNFLFRHSQEERNHMTKVMEYILKRGARVKIDPVPGPGKDPDSVQDCFEKVFQAEVENSAAIYKVVKMSLEEEDWATWNFMQWFVREQTEEETMALDLLDKIKVAGGRKASGDSLYAIDRDLEKAPDDARLAEDVTAENP